MSKVDLEFIPYSLLKEAEEVLGDEFTRLTHRHQFGYLDIFWSNDRITRSNQHSKYLDSFKMPREHVNRFFVDQRDFRAINNNGYYLGLKGARLGAGSKVSFSRKAKDGYTRHEPTDWVVLTHPAHGNKNKSVVGRYAAYQLAPKIINMMERYTIKQLTSDNEEPQGMVNIHGERAEVATQKCGGAIARDKSKTPKEVNVEVLVKIDEASLRYHRAQLEQAMSCLEDLNLDTLVKDSKDWLKVKVKLEVLSSSNLQSFRDSGLVGVKVRDTEDKVFKSFYSKDITSDGIQQRLTQINKLLITSKQIGSSKVNVHYYEVNTGRYHTKAAILQGYNKSVRYAALKGCYEYDLEAAHQNILVQLLDRAGAKFNELDVVREYISKKAEIRNKLANELNTSVAIVKTIIQALTYGANLDNNEHHAIYDTCDGDSQLIERIINHPWLIKLSASFSIAHKHLVGDDKQVMNAVGIKVDSTKKAKDMAHILQGHERQILDSLIANCVREDVALLLHDCVVFYNKQSADKLSVIVREETGFNLMFSEKIY